MSDEILEGEEVIAELESTSQLENNKLLEVAEYAEKKIAAVNKIKSIVLKVTNKNDWIDQNGNPYLQASGCHKVANIFGIGWRFIGEPKKVVEEDGHYRYNVPLEVFMGNRSIEVVGSRTTKDGFFTTRYKGGEKYELPLSEVDSGDVLKASITNAQANGITAILGIRNLTWEQVRGGGIDKGMVNKIDYDKGKSKKEQEKKMPWEWEPKTKGKKINTIRAIYNHFDYGDEEVKKEMLERYKKDSTDDMTDKETNDFLEFAKNWALSMTKQD